MTRETNGGPAAAAPEGERSTLSAGERAEASWRSSHLARVVAHSTEESRLWLDARHILSTRMGRAILNCAPDHLWDLIAEFRIEGFDYPAQLHSVAWVGNTVMWHVDRDMPDWSQFPWFTSYTVSRPASDLVRYADALGDHLPQRSVDHLKAHSTSWIGFVVWSDQVVVGHAGGAEAQQTVIEALRAPATEADTFALPGDLRFDAPLAKILLNLFLPSASLKALFVSLNGSPVRAQVAISFGDDAQIAVRAIAPPPEVREALLQGLGQPAEVDRWFPYFDHPDAAKSMLAKRTFGMEGADLWIRITVTMDDLSAAVGPCAHTDFMPGDLEEETGDEAEGSPVDPYAVLEALSDPASGEDLARGIIEALISDAQKQQDLRAQGLPSRATSEGGVVLDPEAVDLKTLLERAKQRRRPPDPGRP